MESTYEQYNNVTIIKKNKSAEIYFTLYQIVLYCSFLPHSKRATNHEIVSFHILKIQ